MGFIHRLKTSSFARDTGHLTMGQGFRLVIQAAYFVLIARTLGPNQYGAFVAVIALVGVLTPFSGLGAANLFVKNVRSGRRSAEVCWGNGLIVSALSGIVLGGVVVATASVLHLRTPIGVILAVCISDLLLMRVIELATFGFSAMGRMKDNAIQNVMGSLPRLVAIAVLSLFLPSVTLQLWTCAYVLATAVSAIYASYRAHTIWGRPKFELSSLRADLGEGIYFSTAAAAATLYNDIDKVMLGQISFTAAGIYAAAYRLIDVSFTPIRSLASAAYPHFFRRGIDGMGSAHAYATTQIKRACLYSAALFVGLWLAAPLLPLVLGSQYAETALALRWLALIPLLRSVHVFLGDSLSGAGFQGLRCSIQVLIALTNIGLNLAILPKYGWLGAAWTSLASDGLLLLGFWLVVQHKIRTSVQSSVSLVRA
jgi:O-antigen/teichoic acid export membrane protein